MALQWNVVEKEAEKEIERLRDLLERPSDPAKTDYLRGQIAGLRYVLSLQTRLSKDSNLTIGDPGNVYRV
ncbi:MAG: hypothetical protein A2792_03455 [Sphingomonadales bacterium RIFCSPHIGHO2_01_FULL_65_20]|nr:MAG: hypothetical protein A2792_03455 [Sphingomonadales bacterium RIFCSPHIGHO2_01_FULL_65_20]